jgi:predicted DNA-binding transcriptional regulator AlpA
MMDRCENCARLEDELRLTRDALALCRSALTAAQDRADRLRQQVVRLLHTSGLGDTMHAHDIAQHTGVGVMTVWQWACRYPDFPKPIRTPTLGSTTGDVESFLDRHPKLGTKRAGH